MVEPYEQRIDIHYPPEATDKPPVGFVSIVKGVGGYVLNGEVGDRKLKEKHISDRLPLLNRRISAARNLAVARANYEAEAVYEHRSYNVTI